YSLTTELTESSQPNQPVLLGSATSPNPTAFGDFNGDGMIDLAEPDGVHQGVGDGTFRSPEVPLPISDNNFAPFAMMSGDFNGDGGADLAVSGSDSTSGRRELEVLLGNGDGTFRAASPIGLGNISPVNLVVGDFNGDGRADLAVSGFDRSSGQEKVEVLLS